MAAMDTTPNTQRWAKRAVQAFVLQCFRNLALQAQARGDVKLAQYFIALACGLDGVGP